MGSSTFFIIYLYRHCIIIWLWLQIWAAMLFLPHSDKYNVPDTGPSFHLLSCCCHASPWLASVFQSNETSDSDWLKLQFTNHHTPWFFRSPIRLTLCTAAPPWPKIAGAVGHSRTNPMALSTCAPLNSGYSILCYSVIALIYCAASRYKYILSTKCTQENTRTHTKHRNGSLPFKWRCAVTLSSGRWWLWALHYLQ